MPTRPIDVRPPPPRTDTLAADPLGQTLRSLAVARCLGVVARLGLFAELATEPVDAEQLAVQFGLHTETLRLILDVLAAERYLEHRSGRYAIAPGARQWLDPQSSVSVTGSLAHSLDLWDWWSELDQVAAGGAVAQVEPDLDDEIGWLRYIRSRYEFARRISGEVADAVELPAFAQQILDIGGDHGEYVAEFCRRNPMLRAIALSHPTGVAIGQELMWEAGMDRVITHREADIDHLERGGRYDAVFCGPELFGLGNGRWTALLSALRANVYTGARLITLRASEADPDARNPVVASSRLLWRLAARSDPSSPAEFRAQLSAAGFGEPRVHVLASAPELSVYVAEAV